METSNPPDDLSQSKVRGSPAVTVEELQYHFEGLRSLFLFALIALIAMTLSVDICFIRRQMIYARTQLEEQSPKVSERVAGLKKREPMVRDFIASLQSFAASNRDFQPILDKYRLVLAPYMQTTPAGAPVAKPPAPAK
jgi:hypothetical protein